MRDFFVIGHRGAAGEKFENSLSGFEHALTLDIDAIELDIHAHSGRLWVIHDHELERLTGNTGRLESFENLGELRLLNDEPIPELYQVLDLLAGKMAVNIEIKSFDTVPLLLDLLRQYPALKAESKFPRVLISSFDHRQILDLRRQSCPWALAPVISGIPINARQLVEEIKPWSLHIDSQYVDFGFIEQFQHRGVKVMVYTVNDMDYAIRLKKHGIDGIFTDYPSQFLNVDD